MYCPRCSSRTEVTETRGIFRDRRCTNADCRFSFTTRESVMTQGESRRRCARTRDAHIEGPPRSAAARANEDSASGFGRAAPSQWG